MHADGDAASGASAGSQSSELEQLRARCWRQATEIRALGDTISVLRSGATALAVDNEELRAVIACLATPIDFVDHGRARCAGRRRRGAHRRGGA
jgi:hypothetical protein